MANVKKKIEEAAPVVETVSEEPVTETAPIERPPFNVRMWILGKMMRQEAKKLKFDSQVDTIDYVYVDTQQYKELLGACCDACDIGINYHSDGFENKSEVTIEHDENGRLVFVATVGIRVDFFDPFSSDGRHWEKMVSASGLGMGVSRGSGFAVGIAQTNAMRNLITNTFMLPTSDRESDDVKGNLDAQKFLTGNDKAAKRAELLEKTKSTSQFATVQYGKVVYTRIMETLAKDIPAEFRTKLEGFVEKKFKDGEPIPTEDNPNLWIVNKTAANAILSDLDEYNN